MYKIYAYREDLYESYKDACKANATYMNVVPKLNPGESADSMEETMYLTLGRGPICVAVTEDGELLDYTYLP
jgi:hypothetical protein